MSDDLISRQAAIEEILECCHSDFDNEYECGYDDGLRKGVHKLKHLPSAQRWIPVSERLPEDEVDVLVTDDSGGLATIGTDCMFTRDDTGERDWLTSQRVTAWMPLPKPYKEEKNDAEVH